jgi:hypothetical protein
VSSRPPAQPPVTFEPDTVIGQDAVAFAQDFARSALSDFGVSLDFSESSIALVEQIAIAIDRTRKPGDTQNDPTLAQKLGVPFSLMESKSRATRGLMLDGKSFGMSSHGRLILKLTDQRASELVSEGVGRPFYPSPERPLKGWIEVTDPEADWVALAQEAYRIATVRGAKKPATKSEGASG